VMVTDLLKPGGDVHHFEPNPSDLRGLKDLKVVLASGKHLENYLDKLKDTLGAGVDVVEVGRTIPSIRLTAGQELFFCCPAHAIGGVDPHWWHSCENMKRAAGIIADAMAKADPANKATYEAGAKATQQKISALKAWAQKEVSVIPRSDRKLVTAHVAFSYLCEELGFKVVPVLGLSREDDASAKYVTDAINIMKANHVKAVFPEDQANPKVLKEIVASTGAIISEDHLVADGTKPGFSTFEKMYRYNVSVIVKALKPTTPKP
jgi:zinc/manganese transport system substrate-binding protein